MERNAAYALLNYLQKAHGVVPTTGAEWDILRPGLAAIESVVNGQTIMKSEPVAPVA